MGLHDFTIYDAMARNAQIHGDKPAVLDERGILDHRTLLDLTNRLASGLKAYGVRAGDRIAALGKNSREFVLLYGAAAKIGAVLVPINWRLKTEEIHHVVGDSSPRILMGEAEFRETWDTSEMRRLTPVTVSLSGSPGEGLSFGELLEAARDEVENDVSDDAAYLLIYTAAVNGRSRGAILSQRNLLVVSWQLAYLWGLDHTDVNLSVLPLFHVGGALMLLSVLAAGGANVVMPGFDAEKAVKAIEKHRVTVFAEFPPILKSLMDAARGRERPFGSVRNVFGIDHPDTVAEFEKMSDATFWAVYGQTETAGLVTMSPYFERQGSAGRPLPLTRVGVEDDQGNPVPCGSSGEIVTTGPTVFKGYWNLDSDTERTFRFSRQHTGDKGRLDEDGYLWYEGRMPEKELIKPGGENVYPGEVELVIMEHPDVTDVCVIGVPDSMWGEAVKAVCVVKPASTVRASELIEFVAARIARYKKPKHVVFVAELPKRDDGSTDRDKAKAEFGRS